MYFFPSFTTRQWIRFIYDACAWHQHRYHQYLTTIDIIHKHHFGKMLNLTRRNYTASSGFRPSIHVFCLQIFAEFCLGETSFSSQPMLFLSSI
jgi:hypothetical protein